MSMTERARSGLATETGSAKAMLFELEVEQHHHDEAYHREIARLSLHQRLNHMALHFAKYTGKVAAALNAQEIIPVCVDTLIIALSTANILNVRIWDLVSEGQQEYPGLLAFGRALAHQMDDCISDRFKFLAAMAKASGKMAAACEKIDHLEDVPTRTECKTAVGNLAALSLAMIASEGIDPLVAVRERLSNVKQRSKLHGRI